MKTDAKAQQTILLKSEKIIMSYQMLNPKLL